MDEDHRFSLHDRKHCEVEFALANISTSSRGSFSPGLEMSRSADIDFTFAEEVGVYAGVHQLLQHGACFDFEGAVSYVLDEDGMFDWRRTDVERLGRVVELAAEADRSATTFGITGILDRHGTGGDFLFQPGRKTISFAAEVNRRVLSGSTFCDFGWYLRRLVPVFEPFGLCAIEASEY
ncbi:hypothetical protein ACIGW3_31260 [Streptomyces sp. NPDC053499]|uniref:hypothetical protein n=1 Tax=Streptomyces sp. NPDC053499 TaxID=3365707 RepID=UPI0037D23608